MSIFIFTVVVLYLMFYILCKWRMLHCKKCLVKTSQRVVS